MHDHHMQLEQDLHQCFQLTEREHGAIHQLREQLQTAHLGAVRLPSVFIRLCSRHLHMVLPLQLPGEAAALDETS